MKPTPNGREADPSPALEDAVACPLLDGDREAWIRCCTARFMPVARRLAGDDAGAKDALQESWIAVLSSLWQYRGDPPACGWVRTIVRHEALRQHAQPCEVSLESDPRGGLRRDLPPAPGDGPEDAEQTRQMVRILLEVVERLPPAYREIIRLRDLEERSAEAVAAHLRISRSNVASRLHRAHGMLRRRLRDRLGGDPPAGA